MSASVRISLKAARRLLARGSFDMPLRRELEAAVEKATRTSATRRELRKPKQAKRKAKREETDAVRSAVMRRANGRCEACEEWALGHLQLDHFFGRARAEGLETCWAVCRYCHRDKTDNKPSALVWLSRFTAHCRKHGYAEAEARARKRLAFVEARGTP